MAALLVIRARFGEKTPVRGEGLAKGGLLRRENVAPGLRAAALFVSRPKRLPIRAATPCDMLRRSSLSAASALRQLARRAQAPSARARAPPAP